jgi:hypothetical protein
MLQIKLNTTKLINDSGDKILLNDSTGLYGEEVYLKDEETDTYELSTNTKGYGDPHLNREDIALFIVGTKLGVSGDTEVKFEKYNPLTVTQFQAITPDDGIYKFQMVYAIKASEPVVEDYEEGQVIYDIDTLLIYKLEEGVFVEVSKESLINTIYSSTSVEYPHLVKAGVLYTELVAKSVELRRANCSEKDITTCVKAIDDISHGVYSMEYEYCKGNKINAILISDYLNNKDYSNVLKL